MTIDSGTSGETETLAAALYAVAPIMNGSKPVPFVDLLNMHQQPYRDCAALLLRTFRSSRAKVELVSAARPVPYAHWMRDLRRIAHDLLRPGRDKQDDAQSIKDLRYLMEEQVNDAD